MRIDDAGRRASIASSAGLTPRPDSARSWVTAGHAVAGCGWIAGGSVRRLTLQVSETVEPDLARVVEVQDPQAHQEVGDGAGTTRRRLQSDGFERGRVGYAVGYPLGRLSALKVMANRPVRLEIHGRGGIVGSGYAEAWSILTPVSAGLGGISGGVVVDEAGAVRGTVVALDARRGRLVVVPWPRVWVEAWTSGPFVFGTEADPLVVARSAARRGHMMKLECRGPVRR
jgi:hypothetical protein